MTKQPDVFDDGAAAFGAAMAKHYGVARVEDLPVSFAGLQLDESERHGNVVFDRHYGRLATTYSHQRSAMRWAGLVSPLPALQNISMALAGTDMAHPSGQEILGFTQKRQQRYFGHVEHEVF